MKAELVGSIFSLGVVFFRRDARCPDGGKSLKILEPLREECSRRVKSVVHDYKIDLPLNVCGFSFGAVSRTRGLDTERSSRIRDLVGSEFVFHRPFYLTRVDYSFNLSSLRIWVPVLIRGDSLPDWSIMARAFAEVLEKEIRDDIIQETWRSRFFSEVYPLYRTWTPPNLRLDPTPLTERLRIPDSSVRLLISPLRNAPPDLLPAPKRVAAGTEVNVSKDGLLAPFVSFMGRKMRTQHASARRTRKLIRLGVDLALGLNTFLNIGYALWDDAPLASFLIGRIALSPDIVIRLSSPERGYGPLRYVLTELIGILGLRERYEGFKENVVLPYGGEEDVDLVDEVLRRLGDTRGRRRGRRAYLYGLRAKLLRMLVLKEIGDKIFPVKEDSMEILLSIIVRYLSLGMAGFNHQGSTRELVNFLKGSIDQNIREVAQSIRCRIPSIGLTRQELSSLLAEIESLRGMGRDFKRIMWSIDDALQRKGGNLLDPLISAGFVKIKPTEEKKRKRRKGCRGRPPESYLIPESGDETVQHMKKQMRDVIDIMRKVAKELDLNPDATSL